MTLPIERTWSLKNTEEFLMALLDPKKTPRVPRKVRKMAQSCLRHFPRNFHIQMTQVKCPEIWGEVEKP